MFLSKKFIYLLTLVALMCSCVSRKQLAYFQTITPESAEEINRSIVPPTEPRVKVGDALIITVTALDLEAVFLTTYQAFRTITLIVQLNLQPILTSTIL
jgi:hypothetical protein